MPQPQLGDVEQAHAGDDNEATIPLAGHELSAVDATVVDVNDNNKPR